MVQHILGKLKTLKRAEITEKVDLTPFSAAEKAEFKIYQLQNIIAFQGIFSVFSSGLFLAFFSVSNDVAKSVAGSARQLICTAGSAGTYACGDHIRPLAVVAEAGSSDF